MGATNVYHRSSARSGRHRGGEWHRRGVFGTEPFEVAGNLVVAGQREDVEAHGGGGRRRGAAGASRAAAPAGRGTPRGRGAGRRDRGSGARRLLAGTAGWGGRAS